MTRCIYRDIVLNSDAPENDNSFSIEHIIPYSLGGSNDFVTTDTSRRANNDLGSMVDAPFADTLPLAVKRHQLKIKSQNGNINPIVWKGRSANGTDGTITISADGYVDVDFPVSVQRPPKGEGGKYIIRGSSDKIEPVLNGLLRGMKKRKESLYSMDGRLLQSLEDMMSVSEVELIDKALYKIEYLNRDAWVRGMMKIILGLGHVIMGADWTFGEMGQKVRQYVMNSRGGWPEVPLRGIIAHEWDRSTRTTLGKTAKIRDSFNHSLAILPGKEDGSAAAFISLFGGIDVPEAIVPT